MAVDSDFFSDSLVTKKLILLDSHSVVKDIGLLHIFLTQS